MNPVIDLDKWIAEDEAAISAQTNAAGQLFLESLTTWLNTRQITDHKLLCTKFGLQLSSTNITPTIITAATELAAGYGVTLEDWNTGSRKLPVIYFHDDRTYKHFKQKHGHIRPDKDEKTVLTNKLLNESNDKLVAPKYNAILQQIAELQNIASDNMGQNWKLLIKIKQIRDNFEELSDQLRK